MGLLRAKYGEKFYYIIEDSCMGADEFLAALRNVPEGGVVIFLQHPIYWSTIADVEQWKKLRKEL